jgi:hypothetical protein
MIIHKWISSDGSELVPTTDVKINLTYLYCRVCVFRQSWPLLLRNLQVARKLRQAEAELIALIADQQSSVTALQSKEKHKKWLKF